MTTKLVTFDLVNGTAEHYRELYQYLARLGLGGFTPGGRIRLPNTTVIGQSSLSASVLRDSVQRHAAQHSINLSAIFVTDLGDDWAAHGQKAA